MEAFITRVQEEPAMLYVVETAKDVETAVRDLEEAVKRNKFGVLHIHDLQQKMKEKGVEFPNACRILEVCNPHQASRVLSHNMAVSLALPCRISVYQEGGRTKIGTILPTAILAIFPGAEGIQSVAEEVERAIIKIMEDTK
jgi:uncharacterized protein (DUF302 family)